MLSPIIPDCTRCLASSIADARIRHAVERLDFHAYFDFMTVAEIQRVLRGEHRRDDDDGDDPRARRREVVMDLLEAQQDHPHTLWTLLLLVAFERDLVRRRRSLSAEPDVALDHLVVGTFVATVAAIPYAIDPYALRAHVLRAWGRRLRKVMRVQELLSPSPSLSLSTRSVEA